MVRPFKQMGALEMGGSPKFRRFQHQNVSKVRIMNHPYSDGLQPIMIETGMMYCLTFLLYQHYTILHPLFPAHQSPVVRLVAATQASVAGDSEEVGSRALDIWESWSHVQRVNLGATSFLGRSIVVNPQREDRNQQVSWGFLDIGHPQNHGFQY